MKKVQSILSIAFSAIALSVLATGCVDEMPEVLEDMNLSRVLTPSSTAATVSTEDGHTVTFSWTNSNTATRYIVQVFRFNTGEAPASADLVTEELLSGMTPDEYSVDPSESGSSTSTVISLEPEYSYYARVCARNEDSGQGDSKWAAFPYPIDTYTVMDPVKSVTVTERTSTSISIAWELEDGDEGINQIRVSPNPVDPSAAYLSVTVEADQRSAVVGGGEFNLEPSVRYTIAVHNNSANRGTVYAWTRPDSEGAVPVSDTSAFKQALIEAADYDNPPLKIRVAYNGGEPYEMGSMDILGPVEIYGEQTVEGESPVIIGYFNMRSPGISYTYTDYTDPAAPVENTVDNILGATSFRAEALSFSGNSYELGRNITFAEDFPAEQPVSVSVVNCEISGYSNGMFYDNSKAVNFDSIDYESVLVSDISGDGGDSFDVRAANTINSIEFTNSTFTDGMRTFIRIDQATVGSLTFDHNTVNNLCWIDNGNNKGLFNIRGTVSSSFVITDNVFLNLDGCPSRTVMFPAQATAFPTSVSGNYYYNLADTFFYTASGDPSAEEFPESVAISGGGAVLTSDPCHDSGRGVFNVTSASVLASGAGDPRWLTEYVEQPDPELVPVEYGYTWDLTDTDTFYDVIDESCVRGNTRFIVASNPINVTEDGFEFTAEPGFEYAGTPNDCAMAFLVDGPGSVVLSAVADGSTNDHITVAYGPADGSSAEVAGAVYAGASRTRVVFADFNAGEQRLVYVYACGPIILSELSWIEDTQTAGTTPLDTPANLTLSAASAGDDAGTVSLTWDAVGNAGSYVVKYVGPRPSDVDSVTVTSAQYDFSPVSLSTGVYSFSVRALKAETDLSHEDSEYSEAVTFTKTETLSSVSASVPTEWGNEDFQYLFETRSAGSKDTEVTDDFVYNNLYYLNGSGKCKFGLDDNAEGVEAYRYQFGGSGSTTKQTLQFIVGGSGTLTIEAASSGSSDRYVGVSVGETLIVGETDLMVPSTKEAQVFNVPVTANAGDVISIYSLGSGINVFSLTWTPEGFDPDAGIPSDPEAIEETTDIISSFEPGVERILAAAGQSVTIDKVTYTAKSDKDIKWDGERIKLQGASEVNENGMPVGNVISFKVTKPGTIKYYIRSGSSGDEQREVKIDLVKNGSEITNIYTGFAPTPGYKEGSESSVEITPDLLSNTNSSVTVNIYAPTNSVNVYYLEYILAQ